MVLHLSTLLSSFFGFLIPSQSLLVFCLVRRVDLLTLIVIEVIPISQHLGGKSVSSSRPLRPICQIGNLSLDPVAVTAQNTSYMPCLVIVVEASRDRT